MPASTRITWKRGVILHLSNKTRDLANPSGFRTNLGFFNPNNVGVSVTPAHSYVSEVRRVTGLQVRVANGNQVVGQTNYPSGVRSACVWLPQAGGTFQFYDLNNCKAAGAVTSSSRVRRSRRRWVGERFSLGRASW